MRFLTVKNLNLTGRLAASVAFVFAKESLYAHKRKFPRCEVYEELLLEMSNSLLSDVNLSEEFLERVYRFSNDEEVQDEALAPELFSLESAAYSISEAVTYGDSLTVGDMAVAHAYFAAHSASCVIYYFSLETEVSRDRFIHEKLLKLLPMILRHKIETGICFDEPEIAFENLSEQDKTLFIFNLDVLR